MLNLKRLALISNCTIIATNASVKLINLLTVQLIKLAKQFPGELTQPFRFKCSMLNQYYENVEKLLSN